MTRLLLDSSAYIAFKKRHPEVIETLPQVEEIWMSPIVLGELRAGFLQGSKQENNERELRMFLESSRVSVRESWDDETRVTQPSACVEEAGTQLPPRYLLLPAINRAPDLSLTRFQKSPGIVRHFSSYFQAAKTFRPIRTR